MVADRMGMSCCGGLKEKPDGDGGGRVRTTHRRCLRAILSQGCDAPRFLLPDARGEVFAVGHVGLLLMKFWKILVLQWVGCPFLVMTVRLSC